MSWCVLQCSLPFFMVFQGVTFWICKKRIAELVVLSLGRVSCLFFVSQEKKGSFKVSLSRLSQSKDLIHKYCAGISFDIESVSMERDGCQLQWPSQNQSPWSAVGGCVCAQISSCLFSHDKLIFCFSVNNCFPFTIWLHKREFR